MTSKRKNEFYETPSVFTKALLLDTGILIRGRILECCSGGNAIADVLTQNGFHVTTNDIDPLRNADQQMDASKNPLWMGEANDWVISNPPFSEAPSIVRHAFFHAKFGVAFLLRLTFLEPCKNRSEFLVDHPPSILVMPRYSFTGDGATDSVTCAWFIWVKKEKKAMRLIKQPNPYSTVRIVSREMLKGIEDVS